jgi:hypothetical protein
VSGASTAAAAAVVAVAALLAADSARGGAQPPAGVELAALAARAERGDTPAVRVVGRRATVLDDAGRRGLRLDERAGAPGAAWLVGAPLATGAIEVLVRGQDVPQRSFVGVAFAGDTLRGAGAATYEAVYLRPFNFRAADSTRRAHAIQYEALPDQPWSRLRAERTGRFESAVAPAPDPAGWVRLRVEVGRDSVHAFVDGRLQLAVPRLHAGRAGAAGLHVGAGSGGDFAELRVERR